MAVRRFRSVAEMPAPPPLPPLAPESLRCAFELMDLAERFRPVTREPGVRKFRGIEEANAYRLAWEREQVANRARAREERLEDR